MRLAGCALLWLLPLTAAAHSRPLSYSFWTIDATGADVRLQVARSELSLLGLDPADDPYTRARAGRRLSQLVQLRSGDYACAADTVPLPVRAAEPWVVFRYRVRCAGVGPRSIAAQPPLLQSGQRHLVRVDDGRGHVLDHALNVSKPSFRVEQGGPSLLQYVQLGVAHLLTGWDHMLFVLALLLLAQRIDEVVALVTSFTVAHSITLALAVLGLCDPESGPVEALIGFSIALLGAENGWLLSGRGRSLPIGVSAALVAMTVSGASVLSRSMLLGLLLFCACHFALLRRSAAPTGLRVAVAFAFGLVHGFGFASVMAEMDLPASRLAPALFGFNAGVELGQLGLVLLCWPLLRALERLQHGRWSRLFNEGASAAICGQGTFWFVVRAFGSG